MSDQTLENQNTPKEEKKTEENIQSSETIEDTKSQLAEMYLDFLDIQKGGIVATGAELGLDINPLKKDAKQYLLSENIPDAKTKGNFFDTLIHNFTKNLKQKFMGKISWGTVLEYNKTNLNKMKSLINQYKNDQAKLQELMDQIQEGIDPTTLAIVPTTSEVPNTSDKNIERDDTTKREKVLASLKSVIQEDKKNPISYSWWGKTDIEKWLDCSGLLYYTIDKAGFKIPGDSRSMFQKFPTTKLQIEKEKSNIETNISEIKEWDAIFWNSTNPNYQRSTWAIPTIEKDGAKYRIHHVAFIKKIDKDRGIVTVIESNGQQGVTETEVDIAKQITAPHQSELYVGHINYDTLEEKSIAV